MEKLSEVAKELLRTQIGYRNDGLSEGIFTISEIIEYETEELGNEDIYDTCEELYNTRNPLEVIENTFGKEVVYGMWFARKEDILEYYAEDGETEINSYNIPNNAVVISDLGEDGVLFAFIEHPKKIFKDTELVKGTISYANR